MTIALHPAAVLCLWASAAVFFQSFQAPALWSAALFALFVAGLTDQPRLLRLLKRNRVLLVASIVLFGFATPGTRLFPGWPMLGVTVNGLALGTAHMARLVMMVALVAWLMSTLNTERLIVALRTVSSVLQPLGVSSQRLAVRLSLVLEAVGQRHQGWRDWLTQAEAPVADTMLAVAYLPLRRGDYAVFVVVLLGGLAWVLA